MALDIYVQDWVKIKNGRVVHTHESVYESPEETELKAFLKAVYNFLKIDYPKFHKMDELSKLGIIGAEILFKDNKPALATALVFSNAASSLETDRKFGHSMDSFASPSDFVYTLPNIVLGEISIKFKLQGENAFFISEDFDADLLKDYTQVLLESKKAPGALCGWLDLQNGEYDVFLFRVSTTGKIPFSAANLEDLYHSENDRFTHPT